MILSVDQLNAQIATHLTNHSPDQVVVVTSKSVKIHCLHFLYHLETFDVIEIPDGENCKTIEIAQTIWEQFSKLKVTRKSIIIALGGGSVLDITGFCAATFMRGVHIVYIPTTLLALVDSAEGGKNGLNFGSIKNLIGTFNQPNLILNSFDFVQTLPKNELLSGWAEILKHGILEGHFIWDHIQEGIPELDHPIWPELIEHNIRFKQSIVTKDFKETGERKLLNLGHTVGHALEAINILHPDINHGICVANGILIEAQIANNLGLTTQDFVDQLSAIIWKEFPKISFAAQDIPSIIELIRADKKNNHQQLNFTLPVQIGQVKFDVSVDESLVNNTLINWI